jgi:hypothetical protein
MWLVWPGLRQDALTQMRRETSHQATLRRATAEKISPSLRPDTRTRNASASILCWTCYRNGKFIQSHGECRDANSFVDHLVKSKFPVQG